MLNSRYFSAVFLAVFALFLLSACGTVNYAKRADGSRILSVDSFSQTAGETIRKYSRGQCNLFVQDVLKQYDIDLPGNAEEMILSMKRSLDWKRVSMDEANDRAERAQIVLAVQRPTRQDSAAHVCFVIYNAGYRSGGLLTVVGTYQCRETSINNEFDLSKQPPVEFYYYRKR